MIGEILATVSYRKKWGRETGKRTDAVYPNPVLPSDTFQS